MVEQRLIYFVTGANIYNEVTYTGVTYYYMNDLAEVAIGNRPILGNKLRVSISNVDYKNNTALVNVQGEFHGEKNINVTQQIKLNGATKIYTPNGTQIPVICGIADLFLGEYGDESVEADRLNGIILSKLTGVKLEPVEGAPNKL